MSQQSIYQTWKANANGAKIDIDKEYGDQCVDVFLSLAMAYFPGVAWQTLVPPTANAKDLGSTHNDKYFEWIANDINDPNQLPIQGDELVFSQTPYPGYTNQFDNPAGHTGALDGASSSGYTILMQDGSNPSGNTFLQYQVWKYRHCEGWLRPRLSSTPTPTPAPAGHTITLPKTTGPWHLYKVGGPYNPSVAVDVKGIIDPRSFSPAQDLTYAIVADRGNGVYTINSEDYGQGDLFTNGSDVVIK